MTNTQIVKKLIGPIEPVGDTSIDSERLSNLNDMISVLDNLINDVRDIEKLKDCQQFSLKVAGQTANYFLKSLQERLEGI